MIRAAQLIAVVVIAVTNCFPETAPRHHWSALFRSVEAFTSNVVVSRKEVSYHPYRTKPLLPLSLQSAVDQDGDLDHYIRRGTFGDLHAVAELMMESFYEPSSLMYHYHRMLELDRLQNNFPYDNSRHEFFVACAKDDDDIIAFCDVDGRPSNRRDAPPRPYLSDLAVGTKWRRRGVATSLIVACESKAREMGCEQLYLRVEGKNEAALQMYGRMEYSSQEHEIFGKEDTTVLLRCHLSDRLEEMKQGATMESDSLATASTGADAMATNFTTFDPAVLDYSV